jgi:signal transduction histidine kinase
MKVNLNRAVHKLWENSPDKGAHSKWVELEVFIKRETIQISIKDCGKGINTEELAKILKPFYTTKSAGKGTGLGLSISQRIIESHNGKIWVDMECKNTRFIVELPKIIG